MYDDSHLAAVGLIVSVERASGPEEEAAVEECRRDLTSTGATYEEIHRRCEGGGGEAGGGGDGR